MRSGLAALLLIVFGCVSNGRFPQLARPEQDRFQRCRPSVEATTCVGAHDQSLFACVNWAQREYAERQTSEQRKDWLAAQGCPKSLIDDG